MHKAGIRLMICAFWLAVIGLFLSDPSGHIPERNNLINFALHGLEIRLFRNPQSSAGYWIVVVANRWLLACLVIFLAGAALAGIARLRRTRNVGA